MSQGKRTGFRVIAAVIMIFSVVISALAEETQNANILKYSVADTSSVEIASNRHTQPDTFTAVENSLSKLEGFEKKLENDFLEIWFKEAIASIRVVDKRSGYVWGSLEGDTHDDLNESLTDMANSLVTIEYYNDNGMDNRIGLSDRRVSASYTWEADKLNCEMYSQDLGIGLSFHMLLKGTDIEFQVEKGSVRESNSAILKSLYFVPFLGCVNQDEKSGYMFIPDGSGALIRYSKSASYLSPYEQKVYGLDYGIDTSTNNNDIMSKRPNDFFVEMPQISYPVFGMVHGANQNAFFAEIVSGMDYALIQAYPAGFTTDFNWVTARFDYRQKYVMPTGQEGQGVESPQAKANSMLPEIRYTFLTGENANYSGMAREYRNRLIERQILKEERIDSQMPMLLNIVGADVKDGFLANELTTLTTAEQADKMLSSISDLGIDNVSVVYSGWKKGGVNGGKYGASGIEKRLGTVSDFQNLKASVSKKGGRFYLNINPVTANEAQVKPANKAATTLGKEFEKIVRDNDTALFTTKYLVRPTNAADYASELLKKYDFDFSFEEIGSKLYADYSRDKNLSRSQTKQIFQKVAQLSKKSAYFRPNDYMWKNTAEYFDIPMVNSQYLYETDTVPFLQMLLKGSIDYYAPYANLSFYNKDSILKMIEYAAYPSFMLMAEDNDSLSNTGLEDYFSLHYDSWGDVIGDMYGQISLALTSVEGASMAEHRVLSKGVVLTRYSNGVNIVINYNSEKEITDYGTVEAKSFIVEGR